MGETRTTIGESEDCRVCHAPLRLDDGADDWPEEGAICWDCLYRESERAKAELASLRGRLEAMTARAEKAERMLKDSYLVECAEKAIDILDRLMPHGFPGHRRLLPDNSGEPSVLDSLVADWLRMRQLFGLAAIEPAPGRAAGEGETR